MYAVWPHLKLDEHVAFPLIVQRYRKVSEMLDFGGLSGLEKHLATQLSGLPGSLVATRGTLYR